MTGRVAQWIERSMRVGLDRSKVRVLPRSPLRTARDTELGVGVSTAGPVPRLRVDLLARLRACFLLHGESPLLQMKPFKLPRAKQAQVNRKINLADRVTSKTVKAMEAVMHKAVGHILEGFEKTGHYLEPSLMDMFGVSENFYRDVTIAAFHSCQEEAGHSVRVKHLSAPRAAIGIPKRFRKLETALDDRRYWGKTMKRSKALTDRLRKQYQRKLRVQFEKLMPLILDGEISPEEAKKRMVEVWRTSESRVETIFRTETTNYFGKASVNFFEDSPDIIGFLFDSIRDSARTEICRSRHGLVYRPGSELLRKNTPSLHFNCRSNLIALANTPDNRRLLEDPARDPSKRKVADLPSGWRK